jgi:hypothetical protein
MTNFRIGATKSLMLKAVGSETWALLLVGLAVGCSAGDPVESRDPSGASEPVSTTMSAVGTADRYCSTGLPDHSGSVCCSPSCTIFAGETVFGCEEDTEPDPNTPGNVHCTQRGPESQCCPSKIRASKLSCSNNGPPCVIKPDPECRTGIKDADGHVCCPTFCGTCGGTGCSQRTGSGSNCCGGAITAANIPCSGGAPPCVLDGTTAPADADPPRTFTHPGLLNSQDELDDVRAHITTAISNASADINTDSLASWTYDDDARSVVKVSHGSTGTDDSKAVWRADSQAALANALRWVGQGDNRNANHARDILTNWANTLIRIEGYTPNDPDDAAQVNLEAAWRTPLYALAAETIYYHDDGVSWNTDNRRKFQAFLKYMALTAKGVLYKRNNQGASGALALMAAGVFLNDTDMYNQGLAAAQYLTKRLIYSQGMIDEAIYRDCVHAQYTLLALGDSAEIEYHQGSTSLYSLTNGASKPQLVQAGEFLAHLFLGGPFPTFCSKGTVSKRGAIFDGQCYWYPEDYRGEHKNKSCAIDAIYSGYEVLYNHYRWREGLSCGPDPSPDSSMSELEAFVRSRRSDGSNTYAPGYSTLTHGDLDRGTRPICP